MKFLPFVGAWIMCVYEISALGWGLSYVYNNIVSRSRRLLTRRTLLGFRTMTIQMSKAIYDIVSSKVHRLLTIRTDTTDGPQGGETMMR